MDKKEHCSGCLETKHDNFQDGKGGHLCEDCFECISNEVMPITEHQPYGLIGHVNEMIRRVKAKGRQGWEFQNET